MKKIIAVVLLLSIILTGCTSVLLDEDNSNYLVIDRLPNFNNVLNNMLQNKDVVDIDQMVLQKLDGMIKGLNYFNEFSYEEVDRFTQGNIKAVLNTIDDFQDSDEEFIGFITAIYQIDQEIAQHVKFKNKIHYSVGNRGYIEDNILYIPVLLYEEVISCEVKELKTVLQDYYPEEGDSFFEGLKKNLIYYNSNIGKFIERYKGFIALDLSTGEYVEDDSFYSKLFVIFGDKSLGLFENKDFQQKRTDIFEKLENIENEMIKEAVYLFFNYIGEYNYNVLHQGLGEYKFSLYMEELKLDYYDYSDTFWYLDNKLYYSSNYDLDRHNEQLSLGFLKLLEKNIKEPLKYINEFNSYVELSSFDLQEVEKLKTRLNYSNDNYVELYRQIFNYNNNIILVDDVDLEAVISIKILELNEKNNKNVFSYSSWAIEDIIDMVDEDIYLDGIKDFKRSISREEFTELIIKLLEGFNITYDKAYAEEFIDTKNPFVYKAYNLGLVNGKGNSKFDPTGKITRQEMAAIMERVIKLMDLDIIVTEEYRYFADEDDIANWGKNAIQLLNKLDIIRGVGNDKINPLGNATIEEAMVILSRLFYIAY